MGAGPVFTHPVVPGFHPDPSVCRVGDSYYLATSTFEYLPGLPVMRSADLVDWELVGHVATRPGQLDVAQVPTSAGVWAPTIRHHEGRFHLVVTDTMGRWNLLFTAEDAAGPWSDGLPLSGFDGIDPDLCWDEDGTCYLTYSGLILSGPDMGKHLGIMQVRLDTTTGKALEEPRSLWSGGGGIFPEAPHLYHVGEHWYLMIAEGGTERGHSIAVARGTSPTGPFEACPANPVLTARGTDNPAQNTGHGDLVQRADGTWAVVFLGTRPRSSTRAFAPMGRETFAGEVAWTPDGWPTVTAALGGRNPDVDETEDFDGPLDGEWIAVRRFPHEVADLTARPGWLRLVGDGSTMDGPRPVFVGRRQKREVQSTSALLDVSAGVGGLAMRYDEEFHVEVEVGAGQVVARACVPTIRQEWTAPLTSDVVEVRVRGVLGTSFFGGPAAERSCDKLELAFRTGDGGWTTLAAVDGRFMSSDTAESFTGRVVGVYATSGTVDVDRVDVQGHEVRD